MEAQAGLTIKAGPKRLGRWKFVAHSLQSITPQQHAQRHRNCQYQVVDPTPRNIYAQHFCLPRVLMTRSTAWNSSNAPLAPPGGVLPSKTLEGDILQLHRPSRAAIARLRQRRGGVHVPETVTGVVDSIEKQKQATIHGSLAMAPDRPAKGHRGTLF